MEGVELSMLGEMDVVCQSCGAIGFKSKKRNGQISFGKLCCNGNKTYPGNLLKAQFFHTHICKFNSQFAMASLIIDHDVTVSNGLAGAVAFWIMGQLHWKVDAVHRNYGRYI